MRTVFILLLILLVIVNGEQWPAESECDIKLFGKCYKLETTPKNFDDARAHCESKGGRLAEVYAYEINKLMRYIMTTFGCNTRGVWINLRETTKSSNHLRTWEWISGLNDFTYTNWAPNEPSTRGAKCVEFLCGDHPNPFMWNDQFCSKELDFVCEYDFCDEIFNGKCITHYKREKTYEEAQEICGKLPGSRLVEIDSAITNKLVQSTCFTAALPVGETGDSVWIGLTRNFENEFSNWNSGGEIVFSNFASGEPSSTEEGCVEFDCVSRQWRDIECSVTRHFTCERPFAECDFIHDYKCYKYHLNQKTFDEAKEACESAGLGSRLAELTSNEIYEKIKFMGMGKCASNPGSFWIGLTQFNETDYKWLSGRESSFTKWRENEPSSSSERCVEMYCGKLDFEWNDKVCSVANSYVCEKPVCDLVSNGKCFQFRRQLRSQPEAKQDCEKDFGGLVEIESAKLNYQLDTVAVGKTTESGFWLGFTDSPSSTSENRIFNWFSGMEWGYQNFYPGEPSSFSENCGMMYTKKDQHRAYWNDKTCEGSSLSSVCMFCGENCIPTGSPTFSSPTFSPTLNSPITSSPTSKSPTTSSPTKSPNASPTKRPTSTPTLSPTKSPVEKVTESPTSNDNFSSKMACSIFISYFIMFYLF